MGSFYLLFFRQEEAEQSGNSSYHFWEKIPNVSTAYISKKIGYNNITLTRRLIFMKLNSGDTAPKAGVYRIVDSNGRVQNTAKVKEGQTLPPTQSSDWHFEID